jgi:CspA family cold shock protein
MVFHGFNAYICNQLKKHIMSNHNGTVKFFNNAKGFGFITNENGEDIFVHVNNTQDEITEGDKVSYDVEETPKGLSAINVSLED